MLYVVLCMVLSVVLYAVLWMGANVDMDVSAKVGTDVSVDTSDECGCVRRDAGVPNTIFFFAAPLRLPPSTPPRAQHHRTSTTRARGAPPHVPHVPHVPGVPHPPRPVRVCGADLNRVA